MGKEGREAACARFPVTEMIDRTWDLYLRVLGERGGRDVRD